MRSAQKSNRSRGRGNRKGGGGGGNNINRVYDSAGPEGKVRGTPQQIIDKYLSLARDAQTSGDRVAAENFLQHAEHYQRILIQATATQEQARREAQEAATDQADRSNETPVVAAEATPQPDAAASSPNGPQPDVSPSPNAIGGMTTIDSVPVESGLLVEGDETAQKASQPRRNGEGRSRRPRRKPEEAPKETPAPQEAAAPDTPETASSPAEG